MVRRILIVAMSGILAAAGPAQDGDSASRARDCSGSVCRRDCCKSARASATAGQDPEAAGLVSLSDGVSRLASDFNAAKARPRFVAILSPTCSACVHGAEAIKAAILPARDELDVFIVWAPMLEGDGAASASTSAAALRAPGVWQYWDPSRRVGASFRKDVFPDALASMRRSLSEGHFLREYLADREKDQPEWDIYLFFEAGTHWAERPPAPARWVRQTARFAKRGGGEPTSLMWVNDYASAPVEGSLADQLVNARKP